MISVYEVEVGLEKSPVDRRRREEFEDFLASVRVLAFGREEARAAARIRASLEKVGRPIGPLDNLIAGTTVAAKATLVTHNVDEFGRVPGLSVVDWF